MRATPIVGGAAALAFILGAGAIAVLAQEEPPPPAPLTTGIATAMHAQHGYYLVDDMGRSLYLFTNDTQGMAAVPAAEGVEAVPEVVAVSNCAGPCAENWPPVLVGEAADTPTVATSTDPLVPALDPLLVGKIAREGGGMQLTYAGWPLYRFAADTEPGQTNGQAVGDVWYLVDATGHGIGMPMPEAPPAPSPDPEAPPPGGGE